MTKTTCKGWVAWLVILAILVIDQVVKIYIKLHFALRESVRVTDWFYISFIENNGMAFGMEFVDKLFLTSFRIIAVVGFGYALYSFIKKNYSWGFLISLAMVVAGACGNIFDCVLYGQLFTDSYGHVAQWACDGLQGYAPWMRGRVVDMLYFPLIEFNWPDWVPAAGQTVDFLGMSFEWPRWMACSNEPFRFFEPVFNVADSAISVGMAIMILFYRDTLQKAFKEF